MKADGRSRERSTACECIHIIYIANGTAKVPELRLAFLSQAHYFARGHNAMPRKDFGPRKATPGTAPAANLFFDEAPTRECPVPLPADSSDGIAANST